jgi:predicted phage tail component-like protein
VITFDFAGKNSYTDFGIQIAKRPVIPSPTRKIEYVNVPGRDSNLRFDEGTFEDLTIAVECAFLKNTNLASAIDEVKEWLLLAGENDLIFSFQATRKYKAQVVNRIDFSQTLKYISKFVIVFNCRPFKYTVLNPGIIITANPGTIINPSAVPCRPVMKIFGSGDVNLEINAVRIYLYNINEYLTIDSVLMDAYKDTALANNNMLGEFPLFKTGENNISWIGEVSKIEIIMNARYL